MKLLLLSLLLAPSAFAYNMDHWAGNYILVSGSSVCAKTMNLSIDNYPSVDCNGGVANRFNFTPCIADLNQFLLGCQAAVTSDGDIEQTSYTHVGAAEKILYQLGNNSSGAPVWELVNTYSWQQGALTISSNSGTTCSYKQQ